MDSLSVRQRNLPHWELRGATYFITFRLQYPIHAYAALTQEEREVVKRAVLFWHETRWHVHILTVMPDHVHILATPSEALSGTPSTLPTILQSVKGYSARAINQIRGRKGKFWQTESFDRIVRNHAEYDEKANYILNNAAKAGLVEDCWCYDGFWYDTEAQ
ncbi:MAG TPA: transposase [Steroidobacteraceae bacterium]|jgi:REP element-mobilizing transposase RayT|nr:transposase [Steroidobacteraceae bacterium]